MLFHLDTNICISCIRKTREAEAILSKFMLYGYFNIKIPSIVVAELMHGAYKSKTTQKTLLETEEFISDFQSIPFDDTTARIYGQIRATLERKGQVIGPNDMLIAATALAHNATLITNNTQEFSRIDGLNLDDWTL